MGGILVDPWHKKVISSFHIHRYCVYAKENYFVTRPETLIYNHTRVSKKILEHGWKVSQHEIGLRYRTWPHKNKQELFRQLRRSNAKGLLCDFRKLSEYKLAY